MEVPKKQMSEIKRIRFIFHFPNFIVTPDISAGLSEKDRGYTIPFHPIIHHIVIIDTSGET